MSLPMAGADKAHIDLSCPSGLAALPGTMLAEGQPAADFNQLFANPLDDDYRKNIEAREHSSGLEALDGVVGPPPATASSGFLGMLANPRRTMARAAVTAIPDMAEGIVTEGHLNGAENASTRRVSPARG